MSTVVDATPSQDLDDEIPLDENQPVGSDFGDPTDVFSPRGLAELLADRIESNGSKRPTVTAVWCGVIERMIRLDHREPAQVMAAIEWCQADEFWRANILSPMKLRAKFDQMRLQAQRARSKYFKAFFV